MDEQVAPQIPATKTRHRWVIIIAAIVVAFGAVTVWMTTRPAPAVCEAPVRHVIVISMDTTRADHFGCYGNEWIRTPRIDALAGESILFTKYMTVVPSTLASHTSLFTGKYPHSHGTPRNGFVVHDDNVMLVEVLHDAGFHTAGFLGSFALDSRFNFSQGFDHYDETFDRLVGWQGADQNQRSAAAVTDAAIAYLEEKGISTNLFLFAHYFDPHDPYTPPTPYDKMYDPEGDRKLPPLEFIRQRIQQTGGQPIPLAQAVAKRYAGEVSYMDEHIGRLIDYLQHKGILDHAILILTSDHGENFWEHPMYFHHGLTTYRTTIDAVCMMRLPDAQLGGKRVDARIASIDVLPTVLTYLGFPVPDEVDGESIDLFGDVEPRTRFAEATQPWQKVETDPRWHNIRKARCMCEDRWKFIQTPFAGTEELYDLSADPLERNNLLRPVAPTQEITSRANDMRDRLEAWADSADPLKSVFEPSQAQETIRRLRSLGYLGP